MKRLLLLAYLLPVVAFYAHSQSLSLSNNQGPVADNSTIIQAGTPDSAKLITYLYVKNVGTHAINVYSKKAEISVIDSIETTMCWAGACYGPTTNISPNYQPIDVGQTITDFVGDYTWAGLSQPGFKSGESTVRWVFFNDADHNDSVSVTVKYTTYPLGVNDKAATQDLLSNAYPNPADATATFNYSVPSGSQGTIIIRNLVGSTVQTEQVSSGAGKITISSAFLSDGLYFCSLMLDGKISQTKKLVVRH